MIEKSFEMVPGLVSRLTSIIMAQSREQATLVKFALEVTRDKPTMFPSRFSSTDTLRLFCHPLDVRR